MFVLLIIGFARVSSGALVHVVATAVEDVVGLVHTLRLLPVARAAVASDTAHLTTLARLFVRESV